MSIPIKFARNNLSQSIISWHRRQQYWVLPSNDASIWPTYSSYILATPRSMGKFPINGRLRFLQSRNSPFLTSNAPHSTHFATNRRYFNSEPHKVLSKVFEAEVERQRRKYEPIPDAKAFLEAQGWLMDDKEKSIHIIMTKHIPPVHTILVEFRLISPTIKLPKASSLTSQQSDTKMESNADSNLYTQLQDATDFCVTYKHNENGKGISFFCTTLTSFEVPASESLKRYVVHSIRYFLTPADQEKLGKYNGPEFYDLSKPLQHAIDLWLTSFGVNGALCDFIDSIAADKEQREYIRWLDGMASFFKSDGQ